ncbi:hypothetical protein [Paenibacillus abyssi]|uniref:Uncharacterized protein n=1 Tax=Paenibacillus abyssi TaxID=1340531 RepID=A0A917G1N2_9BACL|nr:hypothetical protein [Paenibacillus abyssi]GGG18410.1 hypothetical protein GCM10010916_39050 [Paenibacillus abyssi]
MNVQHFKACLAMGTEDWELGNVLDQPVGEIMSFPLEYSSLIYVPIRIFLDAKEYFLTDGDLRIIYRGLIDDEGMVGTIVKDFTTIHMFINTIIAFATDDDHFLEKMLGHPEMVETYVHHMLQGISDTFFNQGLSELF